MPKRRGQFAFSKKVIGGTSYMKAHIRKTKKLIKPPKLAGVGVKGYR
jgi:hypothetical protein